LEQPTPPDEEYRLEHRLENRAGISERNRGNMQEQEQVRKPTADRSEVEVQQPAAKTEAGDRLKAELDDLLDEIDEVLETNAEDFVRSFVQKGGQ